MRDLAVAQRTWALTQRKRILAKGHQALVDAEVRSTRRRLFREALRRSGPGLAVLFDPDFLAVADEPAVLRAILQAALTAGGADAADVQVHHPAERVLRIRAQQGFPPGFEATFRVIPTTAPTACVAALLTRRPVLVEDITRSAIFSGQPTLAQLLDAGTRAVASYPLSNSTGDVLGVLSFHYRRVGLPDRRRALVAVAASRALTSLLGRDRPTEGVVVPFARATPPAAAPSPPAVEAQP